MMASGSDQSRARLVQDNEIPTLPEGWDVQRFRFLFRESKERNGEAPVGDMLSVSEYRGVVPKKYEHEEQRRTDEELRTYRVVRPGQLAVNTMWLNHLGLGVSEHLGHVSPAYAVYDISSRLDQRFTHHLFRSQYYLKLYLRYLYGIRPNSFQIKADDWNSIPVIVPPHDAQKAIADFLDRETARIDQLIEKKQRLVTLLVERARVKIAGVLRGDFLDCPKSESRFDVLKTLPTHWEATRLRYCLQTLFDGVHATPTYVEEGAPFLRVTDITSPGPIDWSEVRRIPYSEYREITRRRSAQKGDLLLSKNGTVGVPRQVTWDEGFAFFVSLALIRPNKRIYSAFLEVYFQSPIARDQIFDQSRQTSVINLHLEKIRNLVIPVPPIEEQQQIVQMYEGISLPTERMIERVNISVERLREFRSAMITAAVTGQIDVTTWGKEGQTDRRLDEIEEAMQA